MGNVHRFGRTPLGVLTVRAAKALAVSAGLSVLFLVVYGSCNWITASAVECRHVLFRMGTQASRSCRSSFLPYMSIDLFFLSRPIFLSDESRVAHLCETNRGSDYPRRICFLLFPLRFAFPRPHADGWLGALFDWFRGLDAPYNLLPSLHAALTLILLNVYFNQSRGFIRVAILIWFVLIALSPVLTYQHHVIDIVGGFVLAVLCFWLFRWPDFHSLPAGTETNNSSSRL